MPIQKHYILRAKDAQGSPYVIGKFKENEKEKANTAFISVLNSHSLSEINDLEIRTIFSGTGKVISRWHTHRRI